MDGETWAFTSVAPVYETVKVTRTVRMLTEETRGDAPDAYGGHGL